MSKANSNFFVGTQGHKEYLGKDVSNFIDSRKSAEDIISERVKNLDTREHIVKHKKFLSQKEMKIVKKKIKDRTATMEEYKNYSMTLRFNANRNHAIKEFWRQERIRVMNNTPTREWTPEQIKDILAFKKPKFKGKTLHGHHAFSAHKYPHLAKFHQVIYPATFEEHFQGWHGGNWKNSLPGKRIKTVKNF